MDQTHLHLMLNHFPIIGTLIGTLILLAGIARKETSIQRAALATILVMSLIAIPAFLTGEPAEESVEKIAGVSETAMEAHEEAAELAFWAMEVAGLLSLITLALAILKNRMAQPFTILALVVSLVTFGLMARAGNLGGKIRHTELSGNSTALQTAPAEENDED
jgi:uncharacterized membrane protein